MKSVKVILILILLFSFHCDLYSQIRKINLNIAMDSISWETSVSIDSVNSDTNFMIFKYKPKCGMDLGLYLKDTLPDGEYQISHNGVLQYKAFYKKNVKHGIWTYFRKSGDVYRKENWVQGVLKD